MSSNNEQVNMDLSEKGGSKVTKNFRKVDENQNRVSSLVYDSVIGLIYLALVNILNIGCVVIGSLFIHDCTASPGIPIILIVNGSISILVCIIETFKRRVILKKNLDSDAIQKLDYNLYALQVIYFISLIVWVVLIIRATPDYYDTTSENYCHKTVYLFAYWMLVLPFIIIALSCCCGCCLACCGAIAGVKPDTNQTRSQPSDAQVHQEVEQMMATPDQQTDPK